VSAPPASGPGPTFEPPALSGPPRSGRAPARRSATRAIVLVTLFLLVVCGAMGVYVLRRSGR
ncbi:MAG: hypothetical protein KIS78_25475, partial [Labilithrix sp.]|nr:hypothetical protein [Labilithrix sp.]